MKVLAIDTSSDRLLIGLADGDRIRAEYNGVVDRNHSERIVIAIDSVLREGDISPTDLDALAVLTGPGSFTGLRVGVATALGLAQAWRKRILAVSNVELARQVWGAVPEAPVLAIHCRGNEYYVADFERDLRLVSAAEAAREFGDKVFVGAGAARLADAAAHLKRPLRVETPATWSGGTMALAIARSAAQWPELDPVNLDVNYILKSQPEMRRDRSQPKIVDLTATDMTDVMAIEQEAFSDPWDHENFAADIANEHVITLAARLQGRCVGYLSCIALEDYGYIANVAVHRDYRSRGIGQAILNELEERLRQRSIDSMVLDVRVSNQPAIKFYEKYGFQVLTRRKGFYSKPPEDSFTMLRIGTK